MRDAVIVEAVRTPIGKGRPNGSLAHVHPVELLAHTLRTLVERSGVDPALIDDVIGGTVDQVGEQAMNTTRYAVLSAGFPESVPATTVDRQCGSSQQAVHFAAQGVISGAYDLVVACGVESMSRVPMWSNVPEGEGSLRPRSRRALPGRADSAGDQCRADRREVVDLARADGRLRRRVAPEGRRGVGERAVRRRGRAPRRCDRRRVRTARQQPEVLAGLKPAYYDPAFAERFPQIDWNVTAGNASPVNDGASAVLITSSETAARLGLRPLARLHSFAVTGSDPLLMLTGVVPATEKVLRRAALTLGDIDLFEVNEAFSSVVLAWRQETGADLAKVNVHGGAIAIGHPLGASGTRLTTTLVHAMRARGARYALQTMCEAGGLANAMVLEGL